MVLCASVPVIARDPAVCALVKAAMEVRASVETAASAIRTAVRSDLPFSHTNFYSPYVIGKFV